MLKNFNRYRLIPFVQYSKLWIALSMVVIAVGIAAAVTNNQTLGSPLFLGVDFTGGSLIQLKLQEKGNSRDIAAIVTKYTAGEPLVQLRTRDPREVEIRARINTGEAKTEAEQNAVRVETIRQMIDEIALAYGGEGSAKILQEDYVGPVVGGELIRNAIIALILGTLAIMVYIFIRFNRIVFAIAAVAALLHDVLVALTGTAIMRLEVNSFYIAVILTIIGYSINDTIIIYDRVRENLRNFPQMNFPTIINLSLTQTLTRSLMTVGTVVIMLIALLLFGGAAIYSFAMAMLWGMISGAYSSVFIAAPIVLLFTPEGRKVRIPRAIDLLAAQEQAALGTFDEEEVVVEEESAEGGEEAVEGPRPATMRAYGSDERLAPKPEPARPSATKPPKKKKKARRR